MQIVQKLCKPSNLLRCRTVQRCIHNPYGPCLREFGKTIAKFSVKHNKNTIAIRHRPNDTRETADCREQALSLIAPGQPKGRGFECNCDLSPVETNAGGLDYRVN
jgi:hypothetical protein